MSIAENVEQIRARIARAAEKSGRRAEEIQLVAVSKTVEAERVLQAFACGLTDFGENRPQEIRDKAPLVPGARWHQIGTLQSNKIKYVAGKTALIHSVDSIALLEAISSYCAAHHCTQDVLIQLNLSGEATKSGIPAGMLDGMLERAAGLPCIRVRGLMTIGSAFLPLDENKKLFEICNKLFIDNSGKKDDNIYMDYLSMGMSGDFEAAIEMGSNMVRIGTGIFGHRNYTT